MSDKKLRSYAVGVLFDAKRAIDNIDKDHALTDEEKATILDDLVTYILGGKDGLE